MNFRILKLLFFLGFFYLKTHAVIFASDGVYFYDENGVIATKTIILRHGDVFHVCEKNRFFIRQGPTWKNGPYEIVLLDKTNISSQDATAALRALFQSAKKSFSFTLPSLHESPPFEKNKTTISSKKGTGGLIGGYRYFIFNINTLELEQVPLNSIKQP